MLVVLEVDFNKALCALGLFDGTNATTDFFGSMFDLSNARINLRDFLRERLNRLGQPSFLLLIVPAKHEMPRGGNTVAVVLFVA